MIVTSMTTTELVKFARAARNMGAVVGDVDNTHDNGTHTDMIIAVARLTGIGVNPGTLDRNQFDAIVRAYRGM